jgi:ribosomal protein L11 methylase PrmA
MIGPALIMNGNKHSGSFRDPNGFLYFRDGILYRQINGGYREEYEALIESGLYDDLSRERLLVQHDEEDISLAISDGAFKVIRPEIVPFISYPYEWCFSQLKEAALLTLDIQKRALDAGMSLKDATAYNVQFIGHRPVFIDTLSFERYEEGKPWVAYRQFCQHFLAPLALMSYTDIRLNQLSRIHIDGVPLDLASRLLPFRTKMHFSILTHIHVHAGYQKRHEGSTKKPTGRGISKNSLLGLIDNLEGAVRKLSYRPEGTEWADYYSDTNYTRDEMERKERMVGEFLDAIDPRAVWDLGANTGRFSRLASRRGCYTVSFDIDPAAVEMNYLQCRREENDQLLPLLLDLTNPSPGAGWASEERMTIDSRGPVDTILALALVHHLAISNNLPFEEIARYFARLAGSLVIEFIPKDDSQVERLLVSREDIFDAYSRAHFEDSFLAHFSIDRSEEISGSGRVLYLMRRRS